MHVLLVAKDVFQFAEICHYNATTCQLTEVERLKYSDNRTTVALHEIVVYLGFAFHRFHNGKFLQTEKRLSQQEARALSSLMNSLKSVYISTEQQCMLFDSMVGSVLSYASEIWGFHRAHDIEVIHNRFCRFVFKIVKMYLLLFCMVNLAICQCIFLDVSEF
jgi:hypothetical protein